MEQHIVAMVEAALELAPHLARSPGVTLVITAGTEAFRQLDQSRTELNRDLGLLARINNVFDTDYELAQAYANPGRNVFVGLSYRLP